MAFQFGRNVEVSLSPFLIAGGFFGVGCQAIGFDALHGQPGDVLDSDVQHGVLGHRSMAIPNDPFLMEFGTGFVAQFGGDFAEGFGRARGLGESNRDGLGAEFLGGEKIDLARGHGGLVKRNA